MGIYSPESKSVQLMKISICTILLACATWGAEAKVGERPVIEPSGIVIKKNGEDLRLKCSGSSPVAWDLREYQVDPRTEIKTENKSSSPRLFTSILTIKNLTFMDRQTFGCYNLFHEKFPNFGEEETVDVFIDDPDMLLMSERTNVHLIHVKRGMRQNIPFCKPTHPDVEVSLMHYGRSVLELKSWTYTTAEGFTVDPVVTETDGFYICTGKRGDKTQELHMYFVVVAASVDVRRLRINSTYARYIPLGDSFILDCLAEGTDPISWFELKWIQPEDVLNSSRAHQQSIQLNEPNNSGNKKFLNRLTVVNSTKEDETKLYVCSASSISGAINYSINDTISIYDSSQTFLEVNSSKDGNITANASKEDAVWVLDVFGFPRPDSFYFRNSMGVILNTPNTRYSAIYSAEKNQIFVTIGSVTIQDSGRYQLTVENHEFTRTVNLFLTVRDSPHVTLNTNRTFFQLNKNYKFQCKANGYPYPTIEWFFKKCPADDLTDSKCSNFEPFTPTHPARNFTYNDAPRSTIQETLLNIPGTGYILCAATNSLGEWEETELVVAVDFLESGKLGFGIHSGGNEAEVMPIDTENVLYVCSVSRLNYTNNISWYFKRIDGQEVNAENMDDVNISEGSTEWSYHKKLRIRRVNTNFSGTYRCEVETLVEPRKILSDHIEVTVRKMESPIITGSNLNSTMLTTGSTWNNGKLYCNASGVPVPQIMWFKDDTLIEFIPTLQDEIIIGKNYIDFKGLSSKYSGRYTCRAINPAGSAERYIDITVKPEVNWFLIISLIGVLIGLVCVSMFALYQYYKGQKMKRWMKKLNLEDFEKGDIEKINPEIGIETQVNLLPYNNKFEFPRERLKLGMRIGSGAFGQVVLAEAMGIVDGESKSTVAVKMVKPNSDESHFKALMSELKIMIHLGQHVNVVNVLGACTKQLFKKRELLVIVEYCKYGSLLSYLHRHRSYFVDQLDRNLDIIDPDACFPVEQHCQSLTQRLNYAALTFTDSGAQGGRVNCNGYHTMNELQIDHIDVNGGYLRTRNSCEPNRRNSDDYALSTHVQSVCTDMSYVSNSPTVLETDGRKRTSSTSTWNGHYRGVYQYRDVGPIKTTDLLCWCFQIARGMEYLALRNVLHGDLAARNVLLAENNVVKICDFGLAREMYEEKYRKKTEVPLPIKWMALESIYYRIFSTQSDVWSFGVVMWELFTLGKNPYPGMEPDEQFYASLSTGYRMEKPNYAPTSIYDLMCNCWDKEPSSRPNFTAIADRIGDLMDDGLRKHYMDLNVPYLDLNQQRMEGQQDYLALMSGPDFVSMSKQATPHRSYANITIEQEQAQNSGYLIPNGIFPLTNTIQVPTPETGNYQNLDTSTINGVPQLQSLANNAGYVYMNHVDSLSPTDIFSPRPPSEQPIPKFQFEEAEKPPTTELQENSTSTELGSSTLGSGISNVNYIPNNIFTPTSKGVNESLPQDHVITPSEEEDILQKRHKNDSGVSSIDSNFETNLKRSPPPIIWNGGDFIDNTSDQSQDQKAQPRPPHILSLLQRHDECV